jgi:hypothetical protein
VVYLLGPGMAYIHAAAIAFGMEGQGYGRRFGEAVLNVLRRVGVDCVLLESCAEGAGNVVGFWERLGFLACTDEALDVQGARTDLERTGRVSGIAMRAMRGVYDFSGTLAMFRGLAPHWTMADSQTSLVRCPSHENGGGASNGPSRLHQS